MAHPTLSVAAMPGVMQREFHPVLVARPAARIAARSRNAAVRNAASRLACSRQAIIEHMARRGRSPPGEPAGWVAHLRAAAGSWWRNHPARLGLEVAMPLVSEFAGRSPWRFLAAAAAGGALIAVARPWRLLSVSGVLLALAKSARLPGLLLAALAAVGSLQPTP